MRLYALRDFIRYFVLLSALALCLINGPVAAQSAADNLNNRVAARLEQVNKMLNAAASGDANALWDAKTEIEELPYPTRGDRKLARRLNTTALEKFKADQVAAALADFEKAWQADPSDQEITNNYGYVLYKSKHLPEAEAKLRYTLALAPSRATAWANLAEVFGDQRQAKRAADAFVVSHRFSRNPDTTRQYIEKFAASADNPGLKDGAAQALARLFSVPTGAAGAATAPPPLAGTAGERKAIESAELTTSTSKATTASPTPAASGATNAAPISLVNPADRMVSGLPNHEVLPLYQAAAKGSAEARETLLRLANAGNARAQNAAGNLYNHGLGVETNHELANVWYRKSAGAGFILAQFSLAWNQSHGIGAALDYALAVDNYRRAAEQGHPVAMNNLGVLYARGQGTPENLKTAFDWYLRAAEAGLARGAYNAATYMEYGAAQPADPRRAFGYYLSAANVGFAQAQYKVGNAYEYGWGGSQQDKALAIDWYKKAALQGLESAKDALRRVGVSDY